jgi:branched-chain amino acid transport system substrate-binding protein
MQVPAHCMGVAFPAAFAERQFRREGGMRYGRYVRYGLAALLTGFLATTGNAAETVQGVTDTEIVIGTVTDLSGVTAVQGVNNSNAVRMVFDDVNAKGGVNGRKIRYIVEDNQYQVPRTVQGINKLLNSDHIFLAMVNGGTPMNDAIMPMMFAKGVPNFLPLTAARSMYQPYNDLKWAQFASYYDQMRAGTRYFVQQRHKKAVCAMYQDTDFGRDVLAGVRDETAALGMKIVAETAHRPTDTEFSADVAKLKDANCDLIAMGSIVRDSVMILSTLKKIGWAVDTVGPVSSYDTAVATAPGGIGEGFYAMAPTPYAYPDDPRPEVKAFAAEYKSRFGIDPNYLGETGYTAANLLVEALQRAGKDLTVASFTKAMESIHDYHDIFGGTLSFGPGQHHGSTSAFLAEVKNGRWVLVEDQALSY